MVIIQFTHSVLGNYTTRSYKVSFAASAWENRYVNRDLLPIIENENHLVFRSPLDCVVKTIHQEGFRGLFRGLPAVWLRDIPFNFFFFGSYEFYSSTIRTALDKSPGEDLSAPLVLVAGGLAGVTGWSVVFPMDVIKSYMQTSTSTTTFGATSRSIFQTKGLIGFYRGWSAAVLRAFPANGSLFLGYELCNRAFCWLDGN